MIDAETIATALGGRRYGNSYRSPCPVCGGSDKSTKFTMRDAGHRVLVYCHAGCQFTDIAAELRSRGLWPDSTPEQKQEFLQKKAQAKAGDASIYQMIAESALENGESLSKRERRKLFIARKVAANG